MSNDTEQRGGTETLDQRVGERERNLYRRLRCNRCGVISGGFVAGDGGRIPRCAAVPKSGDTRFVCDGEMTEIWRGKL